MGPLVIYHANCPDGFAAAYVAWTVLSEDEYDHYEDDQEDEERVEYKPMHYGEPLDLNICAGREVYILDFSFDKQTMMGIMECASGMVWLDHHLTAFETWCGGMPEKEWHYENRHCTTERPNGTIEIRLDNSMSGAMITWRYFYPAADVPPLIRHVDDYDRWKFHITGTREFNKALWSYAPWTFEQWQNFLFAEESEETMYRKFLTEGGAILRAHQQNVQAMVKGAARPCLITKPGTTFSYHGLSANCPPHLASDVGHALATECGGYGLLWYINKDGKCLCSLRSNGDYNVANIAKKFGGGGHRNAAGMEVPIETLLEWIR